MTLFIRHTCEIVCPQFKTEDPQNDSLGGTSLYRRCGESQMQYFPQAIVPLGDNWASIHFYMWDCNRSCLSFYWPGSRTNPLWRWVLHQKVGLKICTRNIWTISSESTILFECSLFHNITFPTNTEVKSPFWTWIHVPLTINNELQWAWKCHEFLIWQEN